MLRIEIVCSPHAGRVDHAALTLPEGATLADALQAAGCTPPAGMSVGIWGRLLDPATAGRVSLRDRDRIEFHRPLSVDPMEARRRRAQAQRGGRRPPRAEPAGRR